MKQNLKIWAVILAIVAAGMLITRFTSSYVSGQMTRMQSSTASTAAEGGAVSQAFAGSSRSEAEENRRTEESGSEDVKIENRLAEYENRLTELDAQIERLRSSETDSNVYSVKSTAQTELRLWERELNSVYKFLLESLSEEEGNELRESQKKWSLERDEKAQAAAQKNSGGSMESVEYIAASAAAARERVYALVEQYR